MPQCVIEYSNGIEQSVTPQWLMSAVFNAAKASGLFDINVIKTRTRCYEHYRIADQKKEFIHVTAGILSGRSMQQRKRLSELILNELSGIQTESVNITVEIRQMEKETYAKLVKGPVPDKN